MAVECAGIVYNSPSEGYGFAEAMLPADPATPLVWQPLIPVGDFAHPDFGPFSVAYEDLAAMEANFRAGLPVGKGIPIDEDGLHTLKAELINPCTDETHHLLGIMVPGHHPRA
ncbi:MAG: hypothetical protein ACYC63_00540 [Armatimonadota bacterium]